MSSGGAVFARIPEGGLPALDEAVKAARTVSKHSSPLEVLDGEPGAHKFAVVDRWERSDNMPMWAEGPDLKVATELVELSKRVGDVVAFYEIDEGSTMGVYGAWKDGRLARSLLWCDAHWEEVEGEPQPWEAPLFSPEALDANLDAARDDGADTAEVSAIFAGGQIKSGKAFPRAEGLVRHIIKVCVAPLYGRKPWTRRSEIVDRLRQKK